MDALLAKIARVEVWWVTNAGAAAARSVNDAAAMVAARAGRLVGRAAVTSRTPAVVDEAAKLALGRAKHGRGSAACVAMLSCAEVVHVQRAGLGHAVERLRRDKSEQEKNSGRLIEAACAGLNHGGGVRCDGEHGCVRQKRAPRHDTPADDDPGRNASRPLEGETVS